MPPLYARRRPPALDPRRLPDRRGGLPGVGQRLSVDLSNLTPRAPAAGLPGVSAAARQSPGIGASTPSAFQRAMRGEANQNNALADTASSNYLARALGFNARAGLNEWAQGAWNETADAMRGDLDDLAGASVASGRLNTGFYDADQGEIVTRARQGFGNALAQQALGAQGQQLANDQALGSFGTQRADMYADELGGLYDRYTADENERYQREQDRQAKRGRKRRGIGAAIGGAIGGVGGFFLGGPAGAYAGAQAGAGVGGAVGGW